MIAHIVTIVKNFLVDNVTSLLYTSFHKEVICLTIGERIKSIREKLGITQEEFSQRLGTTRNTITNYEANRRMPMDATIKSICREFNVNYEWLKNGEGEMFDALPETLVDELADEFNLDDLDRRIILGYIQLSEADRAAIKRYIQNLMEK